MKNPRLVYRVILKTLSVLAIAFLVVVLLNTLTPFLKVNQSTFDEETVEIDLTGMRAGEIRKIRWGKNEVGVLKRIDTDSRQVDQSTKIVNQIRQPNLDSVTRSREPVYFVYINAGDSVNCPLFYGDKNSQKVFKDICTQTVFDTTGRALNAKSNRFELVVPPYRFIKDNKGINSLVIGEW